MDWGEGETSPNPQLPSLYNPIMVNTADLLHRLRMFVQSEAETQYSILDRQWARPIGERVARGWAIEGLSVLREEKGIVRLACDTNDSRFREGDLLVLHQPQDSPKHSNALHVELQYDGETEIEVSLIKGNATFLAAEPRNWVADQDWFDASPFYLDALDSVADSMRGRSTILPLLGGSLTPKLDYARYERAAQAAYAAGLNESQVEAVAQAYATDLLHLIQGPPGTGKTWVLAQLARLLVEDGQRVLVTALTHRAIHNALNKVPQVDESLPVCKIGEPRLAGDLRVPNFETFDKSRFGDLSGGYIIGATPFALHTQRLANVEFDVVLFDEASQITLPLAIMGMLAGGKYIFIGDENQLPPVTVFAQVEEDIEQAAQLSIFAFLAGRGDETMLNITYRLNDVLADWPSRNFYQSELKPSPEAAARRLNLPGAHSRWDFILDPQYPAVFLDLCHRNTTVRSRVEAETVVELILALLAHGLPPEEVGVVVPYRAQSRLIRSLLRRQIEDEQTLGQLVVDTVERMQGQEREVVLVSFATASPAFALQMADFLFQPQRLNVAVTRPRTKLVLVGSRFMLSGTPKEPAQVESFALLRDLLESCYTITLPEGRLA
jgi:DNA replication ATP-dependent helicase Dna2